MRMRFTGAGYAAAAGVAATAMLGLGISAAAVASTARPAATTACGGNCTDVSFQVPGGQAILAAHAGLNTYNNLIRLVQGSNGAAKEDFTRIDVGTVSPQYCEAAPNTSVAQTGSVFTNRQCQLLTSAGLTGDTTFQLAFNPGNGGPENRCIGAWNNTSPITDGRMRLVDCGVAADTVLIEADRLPASAVPCRRSQLAGCCPLPLASRCVLDAKIIRPVGTVWLINGASDNFSNPVVATSDGAFPSDPRWETVVFNGRNGIDTQEVRLTPGPF